MALYKLLHHSQLNYDYVNNEERSSSFASNVLSSSLFSSLLFIGSSHLHILASSAHNYEHGYVKCSSISL